MTVDEALADVESRGKAEWPYAPPLQDAAETLAAEVRRLRDELDAANRRHQRYLDAIEKPLQNTRARRASGEPSLPDSEEIRLVVVERDYLKAELSKRTAQTCETCRRRYEWRGKYFCNHYGICLRCAEIRYCGLWEAR